MGKLFGIFARKVDGPDFLPLHLEEDFSGGAAFIEKSGRLDSALFGDLGEKTTDIKGIFSDIHERLAQVDSLAGDVRHLRQKFGHFLKLYRDLALLNVSLSREKDRLESDGLSLSQRFAQADDELQRLRLICDDSAVKLEKAQSSIETYEQNVQLLGVAKRELEGKLQEAHAALAALADEESVLRRECDALKARIFGDEQRISDLSEKYQASFEQETSLRERCQALEGELRLKSESFASFKEENARLSHEAERLGKDNANLEKLVNDSRAEMSATFDRSQKEARARDEQISDLKNQLKDARSQEQMFQKVNTDLKGETEKLARELRDALEINRQNEVQITRCEARISRLTSDGEAALIARNQLDQARLAMVSRVEALTQALRAGEVDIRRLENEVASLTEKNQDIECSYSASIDQLRLRIHELEGQLEHHKNENAYLSSKFADGREI